MAKVEITNGTGVSAKVSTDQHLHVINAGYPALGAQKIRPFRQYMTTDGNPDSSNDMGIDGSSTSQEFKVVASNEVDRYISNVSIIMGYGATAQPYQFADGAALTNGVRLHYFFQQGDVNIHEGIKTNQDFFRLSHDPVKADWEVRGVNANNDYGYFLTLDFESWMPPYGIKLDKGTNQELTFDIRDNLTLVADTFNAIAYGFERFE